MNEENLFWPLCASGGMQQDHWFGTNIPFLRSVAECASCPYDWPSLRTPSDKCHIRSPAVDSSGSPAAAAFLSLRYTSRRAGCARSSRCCEVFLQNREKHEWLPQSTPTVNTSSAASVVHLSSRRKTAVCTALYWKLLCSMLENASGTCNSAVSASKDQNSAVSTSK